MVVVIITLLYNWLIHIYSIYNKTTLREIGVTHTPHKTLGNITTQPIGAIGIEGNKLYFDCTNMLNQIPLIDTKPFTDYPLTDLNYKPYA